jgi:hypothetical protein
LQSFLSVRRFNQNFQAAPDWDLVVCDGAHRMAASLFGNEVKYTKRYNSDNWPPAGRAISC